MNTDTNTAEAGYQEVLVVGAGAVINIVEDHHHLATAIFYLGLLASGLAPLIKYS